MPDSSSLGWEATRDLNPAGFVFGFPSTPLASGQGQNSMLRSMMERLYMMMLMEKLMQMLMLIMGAAVLGAQGGSGSAAGAPGSIADSAGGTGGTSAVGDSSSTTGTGKADVSPGGGWAGTEEPVKELTKLAGSGFSVTSAKRDTKNTASGGVSDHWIGNKTAFAHDIGWGSSQPTAASDAAASRIVAALGGPADWGKKGGVFSTTIKGIRYQVLYKTNVGGNHYNHIHLGAKRVG
jgi:hypothetical protein